MKRRLLLRAALGACVLGTLTLIPAAGSTATLLGPPRRKPAPGGPPSPPPKPLVVMVDPGHGGRDPGAVGSLGTLEKDITLDIGRRIRDILHDRRGVRIRLTRDTDRYLPLGERVHLARAAGAHLFVSIHADSAPNREARGLSAYTVAETASDAFAGLLAKQENLADRFSGMDDRRADPDVAAILRELRARHTREAALRAKSRLIAGVEGKLRLLENPERSANFAVLRAPDIPSILIETGFLSNREDEKLLRDPNWRARTAEVLAGELGKLMLSGAFA